MDFGIITKGSKMKSFENKIIQVCSECGTASCWYGEIMCFENYSADIVEKTVAELRDGNLENEEYWSDEKMEKIYGDAAPFGYKEE